MSRGVGVKEQICCIYNENILSSAEEIGYHEIEMQLRCAANNEKEETPDLLGAYSYREKTIGMILPAPALDQRDVEARGEVSSSTHARDSASPGNSFVPNMPMDEATRSSQMTARGSLRSEV